MPIEELKQLAELRDRAFTVFVRAYGQVRHALQYLRRENNDERYAPSLYGHRRSRKAKTSAAVTQKADALSAAVEQGASAVSSHCNERELLPVEQVPEQQQEASIEVDAPQVSASASVPANASAPAPRVRERRKQRRAKRAATRRHLRRKAAKRRVAQH